MASLRHNTEAVERRLAEATAAAEAARAASPRGRSPAVAEVELTPWSALPHVSDSSAAASASRRPSGTWLVQRKREAGEGEGGGGTAPDPHAAGAEAALRPSHPQPPPPSPKAAPPSQTHHAAGPLTMAHGQPSTSAAAVFVSPAHPPQPSPSGQPRHQSSTARSFLSQSVAAPPSPPIALWDPSRKPDHQPMTMVRPLPPPRGTAHPSGAALCAARTPGHAPSTAAVLTQPTDLSQLYAAGRRQPAEQTKAHSASLTTPPPPPTGQHRPPRGGQPTGDRFSMYRASLAPQQGRAPASKSTASAQRVEVPPPPQPQPQRHPQPLKHSLSHRFEVRQQTRRQSSVARRMAQLEGELLG